MSKKSKNKTKASTSTSSPECSPPKIQKNDNPFATDEPPKVIPSCFLKAFEVDRLETAKSVTEFQFIDKRVKVLSEAEDVLKTSKGVVYWMSRDVRVQDNWAMLYAQKLSLEYKLQLHVCFCFVSKQLDATIRHFKFLLRGLQEVQEECIQLNIKFHLLYGEANNVLPEFVKKNKIGAVVCDFSPLRAPKMWTNGVKDGLPDNVPLFQVDAHNIVPCWLASDKEEYAARTIRKKINSKLDEYLTCFPPVVKNPYQNDVKVEEIYWDKVISECEVDRSVDEVKWAIPGYKGGISKLEIFCKTRLKNFSTKRNNPLIDATSDLSPWFHFGQISVQRCILAVERYGSKYKESMDCFFEEAIIRRELSDNFCYYNETYDSLEGAANWAVTTINAHRKDKREYIYTRDELDQSKTHDDLWNSAQIQLVKDGKMHGFLRMYWAKKILEWTKTPEQALEFAIYFNDRYSLDGSDPNGYVGCMWSICGIHDNGWTERNIFGKIRFMNYNGCKRKFDVSAFVARWGGKTYPLPGSLTKQPKKAAQKKSTK